MSKVLCLGEALIDFIPTQNGHPLKGVEQFKKVAGGAPANVSAAIAGLGGKSYMIGKVGDDPFGDYLIETLKNKGVYSDYLVKTSKAKTALAFVSLQQDGERDFMFYREPSADMLLEKTEIKREWFKEAGIFHFGSISLIDEPVKGATLEAIKQAHDNDFIVSFDPNIRLPLWESEDEARFEILQRIPKAHLLKVSEEELFFLTSIKDERKAVSGLMTGSVEIIVVTKGADGCVYYTRKTSGAVKGITVTPVDTTGAGDAFVGGLLYKLSQQVEDIGDFRRILENKANIERALFFANVSGALTTTRRGAIAALPSFEEVKFASS
ncbi:PfkB family carbohydrate kinase [Bacillus shivajii]|uniref:PfkB family carbohydrate kinase n=1 Tax=Bacillus shivajii TaxID=1983719 RepID=UPI001CFA8E2A|nr:PfkB family carbohydrate kinase [Bacillus shivajii]UCZ53901.1 PfkB family carbohydrate kinase [Bacillus shivajii]